MTTPRMKSAVPAAHTAHFMPVFEDLCCQIDVVYAEAETGKDVFGEMGWSNARSRLPGMSDAHLVAAARTLAKFQGEYGMDASEAAVLRASYLLRLMTRSPAIQALTEQPDETIQNAIIEVVCTMPMIGTKTSSEGLVRRLAARGINLKL